MDLGKTGIWAMLVACNGRISSDSVAGIAVDPLNGFGCFVVLADIAHELSFEIGN
jgi:hypothetical protein